jgi:hypothetical protein
MSTYTATIRWNRTESAEGFAKGQYKPRSRMGVRTGAT